MLINTETNTRCSMAAANAALSGKTRFTANTTDEALAAWGYVREVETDKPGDHYELDDPVADDDGVYTQSWTERSVTASDIASARDTVIYSGTTVDDMYIDTSEKSMSRILGAALQAVIDDTYTLRWKTSGGTFVTLDATSILAAAQAVRAHVQACYDREDELLSAESVTWDDLSEGWTS